MTSDDLLCAEQWRALKTSFIKIIIGQRPSVQRYQICTFRNENNQYS